MSEVVICIPAWGEQYRKIAAAYAIPSLLAALRKVSLSYQFIVYTDDETEFRLIPNLHAEYRPPPEADTPHEALIAIHARTLVETPLNSVAGLFNADIVVSEELFILGALAFSTGFLALASFGVRTLIGEAPPIGVSARQLLDWGWAHRHPIVDNCIWGQGKTAFPVTLFFVHGRDNVVAHCSHLHPFLIYKDNREYNFRGTVDDGLLHLYHESQIYYATQRQVGFIELSPRDNPVAPHFMSVRDKVIDEQFVIEFGQHYLTSHCRNLRQGFRIVGDKPVYDMEAHTLANRIVGNQ